MNLKEAVKMKDIQNKGVKVPWDENNNVGFIVGYCGRMSLLSARRKATEKVHNIKTHQIDERINDDKFEVTLMDESLLGWWGLKGKHLVEILDPMAEINLSEKELEEDIPYTTENKEIILKLHNPTFSRFISSVSLDIEVYQKYKEEILIKN